MTDEVATVDGDARLWVSLAEAGRRQSPPVSREAVRKRVASLVAAGRLATKPGARGAVLVNLVAYLRAVRDETDPAQDLRNGRAAPQLDAGDGEDDAGADDTQPGGGGYHQSRALRELYNAEGARLDLEERLGRIADREDVEHRTMQVFRMVRDRLLGMPAALSERIAAQPDARAVRALLQTEIRRTLANLADALDHMDDESPDGPEDLVDDGDA